LLRSSLLILLLTFPALEVIAQVLHLKNGDMITGTVIEQKGDQILFQHPVLGQLVIDKINIAEPATQPGNPSQLAQTRSTNQPVVTKKLQPGNQPVIKQRIEVGLSGASGNSRNSDLRLGYQRRSSSSQRHWLIKSHYQRETSNGNTQENEFFTELTYDWLMPQSRWFRFAKGRYDWDNFEEWDNRISLSGGSGYRFIQRADLTIAGRIGLGLTQTMGGENDDLAPEGMIGFDANWQINSRQSFEFTNDLSLQLDEVGELRNLTSLAWLVKLDQFNGINLKFGVDNEYESDAGDSRSNDLKYDLSLTWELN